MSSSSDHLAVMRPAYMSLPSPNITCPDQVGVWVRVMTCRKWCIQNAAI